MNIQDLSDRDNHDVKIQSKKIDEVTIKELQMCKISEEIENFFELRGIPGDDYKTRRFYLKAATGQTASYYTPEGSDLTDKQLYDDDISVFLDGTWRIFL